MMTVAVRRLARMATAVLVAGLLVAPAIGSAATAPGIVDGTEVDISDAPWMVALVDPQAQPFCDGVLIAPTTVVTAAHCLNGRTPDGVLALGGRTDLGQITDGEAISGVDSIAVEPGFLVAQAGRDIAVLTLTDGFPFQPLPVGTATDYPPGTMATVLGWGRLSQSGADNTVLHEAQIPVVADSMCARLHDAFVSGTAYDPKAMLCAGYLPPAGTIGPDACQGDAGGPLVIDGELAGIVSWGIGCGHYPGFYTRVATYLP
jgi:trypsin